MRARGTIALLALASLLAPGACATRPASCESGDVRLTQDFSGAPDHACTRTGPAAFQLAVTPEDSPINPSPWYAFDLQAREAAEVTIDLVYGDYAHRYRPKLDHGEGGWQALPDTSVSLAQEGGVATLNLRIEPGATRLAAQEVYGVEDRARWRADFALRTGLDRHTIGSSIEGREIEALSRPASSPGAPLIVILGGQHPPEVTGVLGLRSFLETLFHPASAGGVLDRYEWLIVPDLNPDGIERGHWRHNLGQLDLNRDWGPFTQPETRAVREALDARQLRGQVPFLLLDFHSTRRDVLYTPPDDLDLTPRDFAAGWIAHLDRHWTGQGPAFDRAPGHNPDLPTSKSWFAETYRAPGVTVEFGDETGRNRVDALARAAAIALRAYLEDEAASRPGTPED